MASSYRALCSDFYVNQKVSLKLDLPRSRETMLDLFERIRKSYPGMSAFKRYKDELALESPQIEHPHRWLAIRSANIRSGVVNPDSFDDAYGLHRAVLEVAPYFLTISPLDIEYLELLYGFDLAAAGNQDELVAEALLAGSPLEALLEIDGTVPIDFQPMIGLMVPREIGGEGGGRSGQTEIHFEVKTRSGPAPRDDVGGEPISVYVTCRRYEPVSDLKDLGQVFDAMATQAQHVIETRALPGLVAPIRAAAGSGNL